MRILVKIFIFDFLIFFMYIIFCIFYDLLVSKKFLLHLYTLIKSINIYIIIIFYIEIYYKFKYKYK